MSGKASQARAAQAMKEALLKWICITHASNAPLDRSLLRHKAIQLVVAYGLTGFKCSEAWLTVFLKRHGFSPNLSDSCGPVFEDYRVWIDLVRPLFMEFSYEDQFHVDELTMYTDFLPPRPEDSVSSSNKSQDTDGLTAPHGIVCTLLLALNSAGTEKLQPLICAPYVCKNERKDCFYHTDDNSRISDEIFSDWVVKLNEEMAANNRRIVLILSRQRLDILKHNFSHIVLLFFPQEFPTHLRPLRRDVFHYIKMIYRSKCVERLCAVSPTALGQPDEIVETLVEAWRQVPRELIVASFQRTKFREDDSLLTMECASWNSLGIAMPFSRFITFDDDISDNPDLRLDPNFILTISSTSQGSFAQLEVSKNDVEDHSNSSGELETSLKRPSDDSINLSSDMADYGGAGDKDMTADESRIPGTSSGDSEQFLSARDTDEGLLLPEEKKNIKNKGKIEDVLNNVMDTMLDGASGCSPTRDASTPISKDYDRGLMNRVYPSPERSSVLQCSSSVSTAEHCLEEVSKTLENKLLDLEKSRKSLSKYFDDSPIPSTSKGDGSSYIFSIARKLSDSSIDVNSSDLEIEEFINSSQCQVLKRKNDQDNSMDDSLCEKRPRTDFNWAERYEKQLVFGPDTSNSRSDADESSPDGTCDADVGNKAAEIASE